MLLNTCLLAGVYAEFQLHMLGDFYQPEVLKNSEPNLICF